MSGSIDAEQEELIESPKAERKERKHKSKKDKKHKKHKDRRRSPPIVENASEVAAVEKEVASAIPNGKEHTGPAGQQPTLTTLRDKVDGSTPESGEIGDKDTEKAANGNADSSRASPSNKRKADREETVEDAKRLRSELPRDAEQGENSSRLEGKIDDLTINGDKGLHPAPLANPETNHLQSFKDGGHARKSQSPVRPSHETSKARDDSHRPKDEPHRHRDRDRDRDREKEKDRHRATSHHRERVRSRSRAASRDRGRDVRLAERSHRRDDHHERRPDHHSLRHESRDRRIDRRMDDRDRRARDYSRSRRGEDSRSGRDRESRRHRDDRHEADLKRKSREKEDKAFAEKVIAKLEENEVDEDELIEQRRRKRQELLAKLQQEKELADAVANPTASAKADSVNPSEEALPIQAADPAVVPLLHQAPQSPAPDMGSTPPREQGGMDGSDSETEDEQGLDEVEENQLFQTRREGQAGALDADHAGPSPTGSSEERHKIANEETKAAADNFDMFSTDKVDDMFGDAPVGAPVPLQNAPKRGLLDNYDDSEGYYNFQVGEIMNDRYEVFATHGKGVFSTVLRARDRKPVDDKGTAIPVIGTAYPEVAIKVIRANDIMSKAGQTEVVILRKLAGVDPTGKYHIIRLLGTFEYRHHLCLVFEPLESNLRQLTKKYGQGIGLRLDAVRSMAAQMLMALHLMKQCGVLHADIKPDNILINRGHNIVKMCDFGSAMFMGNNEITPYLVSRFYRAPEIILGLHYDHPMDVWSIGCVIYELFTGRILFPGRSNNEMLKLMMDVKGAFPKKMLKKGEFSLQHFEDDPAMSFCLMEMDALTKRPTKRLVPNPTIKKDFRGHLAGQEGDSKQVGNLIDLLEKMMHLDPDKRISAKEALRHPFIKDGRVQRT